MGKSEVLQELYEAKKQLTLLKARKSLLGFTKFTKEDYQVNWHHRAMCRVLDRFIETPNARLMVFMPPRVGKSELVSRRLPAYLFGRNPNESIVGCSYSADLSSRMNRDVQRIIDEPAYAQLFPETSLNADNVRKNTQGSWLRNNDLFEIVGHRGVYRSAGVGGGITGMGFSTVIVDDPIKNAEEAESFRIRETMWHWWQSTLYTRLEKDAKVLITMTRWHEDDLCGRLLEQMKTDPESDKWEIIKFPMVNETGPEDVDPRQQGDVLWPEKYDTQRVASIKSTVGGRYWGSMYQQNPTAQEGGLVKRKWLQFYKAVDLTKVKGLLMSWDLSVKGNDSSDYVVGQVWGKLDANCYLLDQFRAKIGFTEQIQAIKSLAAKWPNARLKLIEEMANGMAAIETLRSKVPGLVGVRPDRSKESRLNAVTPAFEAGNIFLPDPSIAPWIYDYVEELVGFPNMAHDDQVDATTQALDRLLASGQYDLKKMVQL